MSLPHTPWGQGNKRGWLNVFTYLPVFLFVMSFKGWWFIFLYHFSLPQLSENRDLQYCRWALQYTLYHQLQKITCSTHQCGGNNRLAAIKKPVRVLVHHTCTIAVILTNSPSNRVAQYCGIEHAEGKPGTSSFTYWMEFSAKQLHVYPFTKNAVTQSASMWRSHSICMGLYGSSVNRVRHMYWWCWRKQLW